MSFAASFSPIARALIVTAAIAILVVFLQAGAPILAPILLAAFIAVVATPPLRWMQRKGLPKLASLAVIVFVLLDIGSIAALVSAMNSQGEWPR